MKFEPMGTRVDWDAQLAAGVNELRRFIRRNIRANGTMRYGRRRFAVRLENLSEQGCQLWLPLRQGIAPGAPIILRIETMGPFPAIARWHHEGWAGVEFDLPVYPPVLAHIHDNFDRNAGPVKL